MPFPVGAVAGPADLVGREDFIETTIRRLVRGDHLIVSAPRRTGKTSVALEVIRRFEAQGHLTAYLDLFRYASEGDFALAFADGILANDAALRRGLRWLAGHLPTLREIRTDFGEAVSLAAVLQSRGGSVGLTDVLDLGEHLAERRRRPLLVVFDEFQDARKFGPHIFRLLRSHLQHHRHAAYLFLGSRRGLLESLFTKVNEPFYRFAQLEALPPVPPEEWVPYLIETFKSDGLSTTDAFAHRLAQSAGAHPGDLMTLGNAVLDTWSPLLGEEASFQSAWTVGMQRLEPAFYALWSLIGGHPHAQLVASRITSGKPVYGSMTPKPSPNQVGRALEFLTGEGIVTKVGRGSYRFTEKMFGDYLRSLLLTKE